MRMVSLGNLVEIQTGKLDANASSDDGIYPFFTCAKAPLKIDNWKYDLDAILIAGNGDLNVKHYKGKFDAYQRTYILSAKDTKLLETRYLYYFLDKYIDKLREQSIGGIIKYIKLGMLTEAPIPLPPLEEQKRIAAILDKADSLRRARRRAIEKLNTLAQSIFYEMFGDPSVNPHGFSVGRLGVICDVRDGTHDSPKYVEDGYPLLTSKNFSSGEISFDGARNISAEDFIKINKRSKVDIGDIVMPMIGTIGSPVIIKKEPIFAIKNVALIKFKSQLVTSDYIHAILSSSFLEKNAVKTSRGGTQKFIALGDIRALQIPVPSKNLLNVFSERLALLDRCKRLLEDSFINHETLFSSLQNRAFRGEL